MKNRRKLSIFALICIVAACIGLASCSDSNSAIFDIPEGLWGDYEGVTTLKISRHEIIYNNMPIEDYLFLGGEGRITYLSQETLSYRQPLRKYQNKVSDCNSEMRLE